MILYYTSSLALCSYLDTFPKPYRNLRNSKNQFVLSYVCPLVYQAFFPSVFWFYLVETILYPWDWSIHYIDVDPTYIILQNTKEVDLMACNLLLSCSCKWWSRLIHKFLGWWDIILFVLLKLQIALHDDTFKTF